MSESVLGYKVLGADGSACHGGTGRWRKGRPRSVRAPLAYPLHGIYYCSRDQLIYWLGPRVWLFEDLTPDEAVNVGGETLTRRGRIVQRFDAWDDRSARLFAADCAESVLPRIPESDRDPFVVAISAARRYADGLIGSAALEAAWSVASSSMAWSAAGWAACWTAWPPTGWTTSSGAGWAARTGAGAKADRRSPEAAASWAARLAAFWAARASTDSAIHQKQTERLFAYLDGDAKCSADGPRVKSLDRSNACELDRLLEIARLHATRPDSPIHGVDHWRRVGRNGEKLAAATAGADPRVVQVFAAFHDSQRTNDGRDPAHGARAAALVRRLRLDLNREQLDTLSAALVDHDRGRVSDDPTVGACWDADRLDLVRLGMKINPARLSTEAGKEARWLEV